MFARVSIYDIPGERIHEAAESFRNALEVIAAAHGFDQAYFLVSREEGRGLALTFWDDDDAMSASRVSATRLRGEAVRAVDGDVVLVEEYEVAVHVPARREASASA
jgi:heme-degrading monooxygenase HmoA